jgi:hypothetical protein
MGRRREVLDKAVAALRSQGLQVRPQSTPQHPTVRVTLPYTCTVLGFRLLYLWVIYVVVWRGKKVFLLV